MLGLDVADGGVIAGRRALVLGRTLPGFEGVDLAEWSWLSDPLDHLPVGDEEDI